MGIIKFSKTVWTSATAVLLVGLTEKGIVSFTDVKNTDHTVVLVSLFFQFKVHSCVIGKDINTSVLELWNFSINYHNNEYSLLPIVVGGGGCIYEGNL